MECIVKKGSIYYESFGEGTPIIILHSMGTDHQSMKPWIEPIFKSSVGFQRIYVDLPAHGRSSIDKSVKSSDDMLLNLLDFIDKVIPSQDFLLIGFSFGGYLAQGIMHYKQERVKGICLLAPPIHLKDRKLPRKVILEADMDLLNQLDIDKRTAFETLFVFQNQKNFDRFLEEIQPGRLLANRTFLASNWRENGYLLSEEPFSNVLTLSQPALFILGKQDSICGYSDHLVLLEKFLNSSFVVLDQAGHMMQIERRTLVQALLTDWISRCNT
ncbi:MAG TPA: alpha/beta hydrolase [Pseudoneobacillus sp.]|nr:alpha/beta hydrolase [Pseudoneobacillus sp.]